MVSGHIFPKNALQMQKCYLQKVHLHNPLTISEYTMLWQKQNDFLALFPPHGRVAQKISDNEIFELIYKKLSNCMKTDLECAKKHQEWKAKKGSNRNEHNKMVAESVKKSMKEIFKTHMKTLKKCNHKDTDSDSKHEGYHMEDVSLDLEDVNASETFALSDLRRPPQKIKKLIT